jgi:hypothetical protein
MAANKFVVKHREIEVEYTSDLTLAFKHSPR